MGYLLKISIYGVTKCVTRFKRICSLTSYSSDNQWRTTAIIVNRPNQKLDTKEKLVALLDEVFKTQMAHTATLYEGRLGDLTQIVCLLTCGDIRHPVAYDVKEYQECHHARSLLYHIHPTIYEAQAVQVNRLIGEITGLFTLFYAPPTLIRNVVPWRVDLYFQDDYLYEGEGIKMDLSRLFGIVMDPSDYDSTQGLKFYVGRLGDYMVCRSSLALIFAIEQRLKDYMRSRATQGSPASLPTILYGYTSGSIEDVVGKYRSTKSYEALNMKTRNMFDIRYTFNNYDKTDARNYARVFYDTLVHKIIPIYAK
jgi:hypothetical protein